MNRGKQSPARDSALMLIALGALAYICETVGHEALGHGGVCLLTGGRITALAPLWMHCSVQTRVMVVSGPAFNFALGAACAVAVNLRRRLSALDLFLWLCSSFNLLVAFGYLGVGGLTGFGDWPYVFAIVEPSWWWRVPAVLVALIGYLGSLRLLGWLYLRMVGPSGSGLSHWRFRTILPGVGAAIAACAAQAASGDYSRMGLALGCTIFVGWTLSMSPAGGKSRHPSQGLSSAVRSQPLWIIASLLATAAFVAIVGRAAP
jgi:hypothetical protein